MAQAIPYLVFNGNCSEATRFYERVLGLGAKLEMMLSGASCPTRASRG
jgi:PhnB protein